MSNIAALPNATRIAVIKAIVRRHNLRSTVRLTGVPQNQIKALIMRLGTACTRYQDEVLQQLAAGEPQWCETLAFQNKVRSTPYDLEYRRTTGSAWVWTCLDQRTKLVPSWRIGSKNSSAESELHEDITQRYHQQRPKGLISVCAGWSPNELRLREHLRHICHAWFVALDGGFARKVERHATALALYLMYYNFSLIHQDLGITPAIAAGKASHIWRIADIVGLLD